MRSRSAGSRVRPDSSGHLDLEEAQSIHGEVRAGRNNGGRMVLRHDGGTPDLAPDAEARPFVDRDIMPSVVEKNPATPRTRTAMKRRTRPAERTWHADHEAGPRDLGPLPPRGGSPPEAVRSMGRPPPNAAGPD